ncbi:L-threonine 3-dehydrogenase-like [Styela clava]
MSLKVARVIFTGADHDPKFIFERREELPNVEEGEVLVRIRLATICGSDLHTISGNRPEQTPLVLGHEAVGEIVTDKRPQPLTPGSRVTFSIISSCRKCQRCRLELPQKCKQLEKLGHLTLNRRSGFHGCYATHVVLGCGTHVSLVPSKLSDRMVAPINCALATMVNAVECGKTNVQDKTALVLGAGLLGIYGCALLRDNGYDEVFCCDIDRNRLKFVSKFGGKAICPEDFLDDEFLVDSVDTVIEVCGNPDVIQDGYRRLRHGGMLVLVGLVHPNSNLSITGEQIIRKCITIRGVHNYAPRHLDRALEFLSRTAESYPYEELVSPNPFSLEEIEKAITETNKKLYHRSCVKP